MNGHMISYPSLRGTSISLSFVLFFVFFVLFPLLSVHSFTNNCCCSVLHNIIHKYRDREQREPGCYMKSTHTNLKKLVVTYNIKACYHADISIVVFNLWAIVGVLFLCHHFSRCRSSSVSHQSEHVLDLFLFVFFDSILLCNVATCWFIFPLFLLFYLIFFALPFYLFILFVFFLRFFHPVYYLFLYCWLTGLTYFLLPP